MLHTGTVTGENYSGGIVGRTSNSTVSHCYNLADITSNNWYAGGITGLNDSGTVEYCYNTGYIWAADCRYTGGIAGSTNGIVQYCYNIGDLDGSYYWGYIVGENTGTVQNCYYDSQMAWFSGGIGSAIGATWGVAADDTANHVEGKTTANMLGDLFGDTTNWTADNNLYPRLADPSGSAFDMDTTDAAYVSATPIHLAGNETIAKVTKDFTVCTDNGVSWSSSDSDYISITGGDAEVLRGWSNDCWYITLTAALNDSSKKVYYIAPYSDNASLTSILSQSITAGSEAGTTADPKTASISVANSVSGLSADDITPATGATVTFYGTDSTFTTIETGSVSLAAGGSTTVYIKVTAQDGTTTQYYAVTISRAAASTPPATSDGGSDSSNDGGGAEIIVNGETHTAGTVDTVTNDDGKTTTTVTVDEKRLAEVLETAGDGTEVIVPVPEGSNRAKGILTGQMVSDMEDRSAILVVQTENSSYTLPAKEINIDAVAKQLGEDITLSDIEVAITISEPDDMTVKVVANTAENGGFSLVVPAVDYNVECTYNGRRVEVDTFNSYVERTIAIPDGVDPSKITTGIVVNPDGTTRHVPTKIVVIDGKYYATINSLTNSTYAVVWHPYEFSDVTNHWAKDSINNMGSRMVVNGIGEGIYEPDRNMTRAEFAAIIVKALGLAPGEGATTFNDVSTSDWYNGYAKTAAEYGIITGYPDGSFGPMDAITREQAMTMIARAMSIIKLDANLASGEETTLLDNYSDSGTISEYAINSIAQCVKVGIVSGRTETTIAPAENITRAEVAAIVERLLKASDLID